MWLNIYLVPTKKRPLPHFFKRGTEGVLWPDGKMAAVTTFPPFKKKYLLLRVSHKAESEFFNENPWVEIMSARCS